jgi:hypothetical protein
VEGPADKTDTWWVPKSPSVVTRSPIVLHNIIGFRRQSRRHFEKSLDLLFSKIVDVGWYLVRKIKKEKSFRSKRVFMSKLKFLVLYQIECEGRHGFV